MKILVDQLPENCKECVFWVELSNYNHGVWHKYAYAGCVLGKKPNQYPDDFEKPVGCPLAVSSVRSRHD